ncbi:MAG: hypothetical protein R8M11_05590 [Gallionella sp.]
MPTKRQLDNSLNPILGLNLKPVANAKVIFNLVDATGRATDVWTDGARIAGMLEAVTDDNGVFWDYATGLPLPVELWANDEGYTPTRYSCRVIASGVVIHDFIGSVPAGATPLSWQEFMANGNSLSPVGLGEIYLQHSLATVINQFLVSTGAGQFEVKTIAQLLTILSLSNVDNTTDADKPISIATQVALTPLQAHEASTANPHGVTKAQVGLSSADNTADVDKPISAAAQTALNNKADTVNGVIPLSQIPVAAVERVYTAASQAARYALTINEVQNGDQVRQADTGIFWAVVDDTNLGNASGYAEVVSGFAALVDWTGVLNVPVSQDVNVDQANPAMIPSVKAVYDWVVAQFAAFVAAFHIWDLPQVGKMNAGAASVGGVTVIDFALGNNIDFGVMSQSTTLATPINATIGQNVHLHFKQSAGNSFSMSYGAGWAFGTTAPPVAPTTVNASFVLAGTVQPNGIFLCNMVKENGLS